MANYQTGQLHHESAYLLVDKVLTEQTQAIVCASDTLALGVIKRLQELQRDDVVVTGWVVMSCSLSCFRTYSVSILVIVRPETGGRSAD